MTTVDVDFGAFSVADRIRHFEVEGYVVLPGVLTAEQIGRIKDELVDLPMMPSFYSPEPTFSAKQPQWHGRACAELIGQPRTTAFLRALLGEELLFTHGMYILSHPGDPRQELHCDYKPYGSTFSRWDESCPVAVRVLHYLDDSRPDRAALRIIPRSHLCVHADAHPYRRYESHPEEVPVPMRAGDAFIFAVRLFHGTCANTTNDTRGMILYDYRPLWARPVMPVEDFDPALVAAAPEQAKPFLRSLNSFDKSWEFANTFETSTAAALGMSPSRWEHSR